MDRRFVGRKVICLCRGKMLEYENCYRNKRYNISNSNKNDFRVCHVQDMMTTLEWAKNILGCGYDSTAAYGLQRETGKGTGENPDISLRQHSGWGVGRGDSETEGGLRESSEVQSAELGYHLKFRTTAALNTGPWDPCTRQPSHRHH